MQNQMEKLPYGFAYISSAFLAGDKIINILVTG
jgi:hypothetical protein